MPLKWIKLFLASAGAILLAAALERFLFAASQVPLSQPEVMLGIPLRYAVLLVGGLELTGASLCLFGKRTGLQLGWLAWLATNYAGYRIGLLVMHCQAQASGIGSYLDPLHLTRGPWGLVFGFLPMYLLLGSYAALLWLWWAGRRAKAAEFQTMSCPACGGHIRFATQNAGQPIPCPHCQKTITLHPPENLKMSCFFCQGHIEFPAHAIGEKMPCPHCHQDITLKEPA